MALSGIAALDSDEALYLSRATDDTGRALSGGQRYRLRIPAGGLPAQAFWSLSLYEVMPDGRLFFTPNAPGRHSVGNRTRGLRPNADGSVDLLLQRQPPADMAQWLPAPAGEFRLILRAYGPSPALVRGEVPLPTVEPLGD